MNLSSLQQECARLLSDKNNDRWPLDVLATRINIAMSVIQGYASPIKLSESIALVSGTSTYGINADTMDIIRVYKVYTDGSLRPLQGIGRDRLDFSYPDWNQWQPGEPKYWIYDATNQALILAPVPDASVASLTIYESRKPADLVNSTDIPFDSNNRMTPYHITICHWVVAQCFSDDGTPEALMKSKFHRSGDMMKPGEFEKNLGRIMAEFDVSEAVPEKIMWQPQGARLGYNYWPQKSYPFLY